MTNSHHQIKVVTRCHKKAYAVAVKQDQRPKKREIFEEMNVALVGLLARQFRLTATVKVE